MGCLQSIKAGVPGCLLCVDCALRPGPDSADTTRVTELDPNDTNLDTSRIDLLCELGRFDQAAAAAVRLVHAEPENVLALTLLAVALHGLGDHAGSLTAADRAIALEPESEWPVRVSALALEGLGRPASALERIRWAIAVAPDGWAGHALLAHRLSQKRSTRREAVAAGHRAVSLAPHEPGAYRALAEALRAAGRRREAEECLRQALALQPNDWSAQNDLVRLQMQGRSRTVSGLTDAAQGFAQIVAQDPRNEVSSYNLGLVLRKMLFVASAIVFFDGFSVMRAVMDSDGLVARLAPVLVLVVPVVLAIRLVRPLSPRLRAELMRTARSPRLAVPLVLDGLAAVLIVAAAIVPAGARGGCAMGAAMGALLAGLFMTAAGEHYKRQAPGPLKPHHRVDTGVIAVGILVSGFFALFLVPAAIADPSPVSVGFAAAFAAATGLQIRAVVRRARAKRR